MPRKRNLQELIYDKIDTDVYLIELYNDLLKKYTRQLFKREIELFADKELSDLLTFADLLSKSTHPRNKGMHKVWSQQIIALLSKLYPNNAKIEFYKLSILNACNNYPGIETAKSDTTKLSNFDKLINYADKDYLKVPLTENKYFMEDQKIFFDNFDNHIFSYSAPTSMGKSYVMRMFIKNKISSGSTCNFAIIVPTKALINEVRSKMLEDLIGLEEADYRVIISASDALLEQDHHFIFIMTPERFLYLQNTTEYKVNYLFIDEAHKISSKDARSNFYYEIVDNVSKDASTHTIFASPNIPNPEEYNSLGRSNDKSLSDIKISAHRATFSPVSQIKYLINLQEGSINVFNDYNKSFIQIGNKNPTLNLPDLIKRLTTSKEQNIVYCSSLKNTIEQAVEYGKTLPNITIPKVKEKLEAISKEIKTEINPQYFLAELVLRGVAFHVGYLPSSIRNSIEKAFKNGDIRTLFCTSTLIEGVNLPADNLFITDYKNGRSLLDPISFRNLIGRVGRIDMNLFGNVFMVCLKNSEASTLKKYDELLTKDIKEQKVSIQIALKESQKKAIIDGLVHNDFEMRNRPETTAEEYSFMRKQATLFVKNLLNGENTLIVRELSKYATTKQLETIKVNAKQNRKTKGLDVTPDQIENLEQSIANGLTYPPPAFGEIDFNSIEPFLTTLSKIFKWNKYEKKTLGYESPNMNYTHIPWYSTILYKWMDGRGLSQIISDSIRYKEQHPYTGIWANNWKIEDYYNYNNPYHKNLIIADTLNTIENVILYSIANYFREFSTEYKRQKTNGLPFENDWYEYVEFGTTNPLTIYLQRYGYSREVANYIKKYKDMFVDFTTKTSTAPFSIKYKAIKICENENLKSETKDVILNVPELFIQ